jgi:Flp pilus assembly protein TadG
VGKIAKDTDGSVLVETTVMMTLRMILLCGCVDFLFAFYQWNTAAKAVQVGARIAAVSAPVAAGLNSLSAVATRSIVPGRAMPSFTVACNGATTSCTCTGFCTGVGDYDAAAMNTIIFGRGSMACNDATSYYFAGMCDIFDKITPANVVIVYTQNGLGYSGRPGGPVPTITVSLQNLSFQFFFLGVLKGLDHIPMPAMTTTITGEDLCSGNSCF